MIDKGDVTAGIPGLAESLDLMPLGACVIDVDMTVRVWNRTLVEWTGIPREEALGMDLAERFPGLRGIGSGGGCGRCSRLEPPPSSRRRSTSSFWPFPRATVRPEA